MFFTQNKKRSRFFVCSVITCCCLFLFIVGFYFGRRQKVNECSKEDFEIESQIKKTQERIQRRLNYKKKQG